MTTLYHFKEYQKIFAVTGHRPDKIKINNINAYNKEVFNRLVDLARKVLIKYEVKSIMSGMALGWDTAIADAAIALGVNLISVIPFVNQDKYWKQEDKDRYKKLLKNTITISSTYNKNVYQKRNMYMVDNSDIILALWDGSKGGTYNCIKYAESNGKKIINVWKSWEVNTK